MTQETTTQPQRVNILWAERPALYLADLIETDHPGLARRLRASEWVPMSLDEARAVVAATATPTVPDWEERESAWTHAIEAVPDIERAHERVAAIGQMRETGLWRWICDRASEEDTTPEYIAETRATACLWPNGRHPGTGERILEEVRRRGEAQGIAWIV